MEEDFLANVRHEGEGDKSFNSLDDAIASVIEPDKQETETPTTPPVDTNQTENAPSSQGAENTENANNVPWHKDPRWIEWQQQKDELLKFKEEVEPKLAELNRPQAQSEIPAWFGGDEQAWTQYKADLNAELSRVKQETVAEYERRQRTEADKVKQAQDYVSSELARLRSAGKQFDDNELLKVLSDYPLVRADGNWDLEKAYDVLELKKAKDPANLEARKQIAGATKSTTTGEPTAKSYFTPADFRGKRF